MKMITAFGDSVLKGVVTTESSLKILDNSFARICEKALEIKVTNKAIMGSTIVKGRQVFERALETVKESDSEYVILEFGGNDCDFDWAAIAEKPDEKADPHVPLKLFRKEYEALIRRVRELGKEPLMLSLPPIDAEKFFRIISKGLNADNILHYLGRKQHLADWHEMYNLEAFKIARDCGVTIFDITSCFLEKKDYEDLLCYDGIHPNEKGHALIADVICSYVKGGSCCGKKTV